MAYSLTPASPLRRARRRFAARLPDPLPVLAVTASLVAAPVVGYLLATGRHEMALLLSIGLPSAALLLRLPFAGVLLWVLVMPYFVEISEEATPARWALHRMAPLALLGVVAAYHFLGIRTSPFRIRGLDYLLGAFLVLGLLNVFAFAPNPVRMTASFYDSLVAPILFFWLVRATGLRAANLTALLLVGLWTISVQAGIGWVSWVAPELLPAEWLSRAGERTAGTFGGPGPFTVTVIFFTLLAVHRAGLSIPQRHRLLIFVIVAVGLISVFFSLSRGSWLGAALAMGGAALLYPRFMIGLTVPAVVIGAAVAMSPLGGQVAFAQQRLGDEETVEARLVTNDAALRMIADRPISGFGFGNFERFDESYKRRLEMIAFTSGGSAHNTYLNFLAEFGIPLSVLYFGVPVVLLVQTVAHRRMAQSNPAAWKLILLLWLAVLDQLVVSNFLEMVHSSPWGTTLWWLSLAMIVVTLDTDREERPRHAMSYAAGLGSAPA